jgi:hypothetical protein
VWLRYFSLVFYQVLDVASLTLFLMTMDCQYFSVEKSVQGHNQQFSDVCKSQTAATVAYVSTKPASSQVPARDAYNAAQIAGPCRT